MREGLIDISYTARSHALQLMRFHMHDWIMIFGLMLIVGMLNLIHPFYRFVGKTMLDDLMFPLKENTVPFWAVPILAVIVPIIVIFIYYLHRRDVNDLHHAILGLLFSVCITAVITDAVKDAVGRPRPDFFWRCFPDGISMIVCGLTCFSAIRGSSLLLGLSHPGSFAGLGFLALYLAAKIKIFDRKGHIAKLCIVFLPLLVATLVGVSRVDDYWHHWQDVFAGALLGLTMATLCYRQFFPAPYDSHCGGPYACFQILTEDHTDEIETANGWNAENGPYFRVEGTHIGENGDVQEGGAINSQTEHGPHLI